MHFQQESMMQIIDTLQHHLQEQSQVTFTVLNPDISEGTYAGEIIEGYIYRSYRTWMDTAQIMMCRMLTPEKLSNSLVKLTFKKLQKKSSFHTTTVIDKKEKYGEASPFFHIHKNEEAAFIDAYTKALRNINLEKRTSILNLGVNRADEFKVIQNLLLSDIFEKIQLVGVDHSQTALKSAKENFPKATFYAEDINKLDTLHLEKFDLIISIGTLQSPGINFKPFFNTLVQNYLQKDGAIILGFPNSRWIDGEMIYGAKMPNYSESDLSLLINDIHYCKKYLQQKRFKVRLHGKEYIFLSAFK